MVGLPETDVARVQRWCRGRVPDRVRDQIRIEVDVAQRHLTVVECRPPWDLTLITGSGSVAVQGPDLRVPVP